MSVREELMLKEEEK